MNFLARVDLDFVSYEGSDHPAVLLRLLQVCRDHGFKVHFFITSRTLRAFPAAAEAILNEGHHLDWWMVGGQTNANELFARHGIKPEFSLNDEEITRFDGNLVGAEIAHAVTLHDLTQNDPRLKDWTARVQAAISSGRKIVTLRDLARDV